MLKKNRELTIVVLSFTLITLITTVATAAFTDIIWTYSDSSYTEEATEFGNGSIVYLKATDTETKSGTKEIISEASATVGQFPSLGFQKPFIVRSGSAKVIIRIREPANVTIKISNLKRELVYDWNDYILSGEEKEWTWDGHNMYGEEVNNGVYIWEMEARTANGESQKETKILGVLQ